MTTLRQFICFLAVSLYTICTGLDKNGRDLCDPLFDPCCCMNIDHDPNRFCIRHGH